MLKVVPALNLIVSPWNFPPKDWIGPGSSGEFFLKKKKNCEEFTVWRI